jgi:hypothetical protein
MISPSCVFSEQRKKPKNFREMLTNQYYVIGTALVLYLFLDLPFNLAIVVVNVKPERNLHWGLMMAMHMMSLLLWTLMMAYFAARVRHITNITC